MNYKLRQLPGFVAAARELAMTQPAFSQMVREFETTLGLFERTARRVELTEAGQRLRALRISEPQPERRIGIITRADRALSPAAAEYVEMLFSDPRRSAYNALLSPAKNPGRAPAPRLTSQTVRKESSR